MSQAEANATKPETGECCDHTHKDLVCERLIVKRPNGKSSVTIMATEAATGVWVATGTGTEQVGLVAQPGVGPYLVLWSGKERGLPSIAITPDHVQLPSDSDSDPRAAVIIPFRDLLTALRQLNIAPPPA